MSKINLTAAQKTALVLRHKQTRDSRECDRIKAVLLSAKGWTAPDIAEALLIEESSVRRHVKAYQSEQKLTNANGGSTERLSESQSEELIAHLTDHLYQHNHQIVATIKTRFGITYTVSGLHKWLHRHGFVYKQPKGVPAKADKAQQQAFIEQYHELKATVGEDEVILFGDGVHPTQATKLSHGWIKKGTDKQIKTSASRTRINLLGTIELGNLANAITATYDTINADSIIDFMSRCRVHYSTAGTLHWIIDGAGYHQAKIVQDKARELNIHIHILPPYSPNLNPIERLWKVMNEEARNNEYFHSAKAFREKIDDFFKLTLPNIADSLNSRINDNFQIIDPAS